MRNCARALSKDAEFEYISSVMTCDFCHENDAIIFIEQVSGGVKRKISICQSCAEARGINGDPRSVEKGLANIVREILTAEAEERRRNEKLCPVCGISLGRILKGGRLGCPECYSVFKADVLALMAKKGIVGPYTGSMPHRLRGFRSTLTDRILYQGKLDEALAREDYEKAAFYRDYLKSLEKSPVADGGDGAEAEEDGGQ